jgi:tetratricopeptide (TPR) repeat protein
MVAAALLLLVATATEAGARPGQTHGAIGGAGRLLDVPYLPQTPDLCGGAAVAMVLRYWGERQVYAEDFEHLVDRSVAGIRTDALAAEVGRRGWQALPYAAPDSTAGEWMHGHVNNGRPVIALIEVGPDRYHYVVIVAWTGERVIAHDPARAPFRVLSRAEFDGAWAAAGHWALLVLPSTRVTAGHDEPAVAPTRDMPSPGDPCDALVREMVARARAGDLAAADLGLSEATRLCPRLAPAWRELAGVRFLQQRWGEASRLADRATRLDPDDAPGWDLLATSRFLNGEPGAALDAWNRIGRPTVDLVRVAGAVRTRHPVIASVVGLAPRTMLSAERLGRAARRLDELPGAARTGLRYRPVDGGLAEIDAVVVERTSVPRRPVPLALAAARAWTQREIAIDVATPTGSGELWTAAWRWWEARPRVGFALAVPSVARLPGVTTVEGFWERQTYAIPGGPDRSEAGVTLVEERRRAAVSVADWATSRIRWRGGAALDRWADDSHVTLDGAIDLRLARDHVALGAEVAGWTRLGSGGRFVRGGVSSAWRSTRDADRPSWHGMAGTSTTTSGAPFDLWPGAGTGHARTPLLRAHPLLDEGIVSGLVFGRHLVHGTFEYRHPVVILPGGAIQLGVFADTARAWRAAGTGASSRWHTDIGAGVRVALPGRAGTARIDVARGLRDGRTALSAGWQAPWPGR